MGATDTDICNNALSKVGAQRILSINDTTPAGRACQGQYDNVKKMMLRSHPWNFATKRVELNLLSTEPIYEFDYQYQLPEDCLRVLSVEADGTYPWKVEGRYLLTNTPAAFIKYIGNVAEGMFDDNFIEAMAYSLAMRICMPLTQSASLLASLTAGYKQAIREARSYDAQESAGDRVYADTWLNSRV